MPVPQNYKLLAFLPLVFIVGSEGFAMFAPYVIFLMSVAYITRLLRSAPEPVPVSA